MMEEVLKADVFFFVTTVAVMILTILGIIISVYLVRILREVEYIARVAREEVDELSDDITEIADDIKESVEEVREGVTSGVGGIIGLLLQTIMGVRAQRKKKGTGRHTKTKKRT